MAFDILISDSDDKPIKSIPVFLKDYDQIMKKIELKNNFPILNKMSADYYGEEEVYLNQLNDLKSEVVDLTKSFNSSNITILFLKAFFELIEIAIRQSKTIKFIGD